MARKLIYIEYLVYLVSLFCLVHLVDLVYKISGNGQKAQGNR
jgi:hypothetical protein